MGHTLSSDCVGSSMGDEMFEEVLGEKVGEFSHSISSKSSSSCRSCLFAVYAAAIFIYHIFYVSCCCTIVSTGPVLTESSTACVDTFVVNIANCEIGFVPTMSVSISLSSSKLSLTFITRYGVMMKSCRF